MQKSLEKIPILPELRSQIASSKFKSESMTCNVSRYEKFLFLVSLYPNLKAVPSKAIDEVWHFHLKNKSNYDNDCISNFGKIIYHKQAKSTQDFIELEANYKLTNKVWFDNFNCQLGNIDEMALCGVGDDGEGGNDE